jgi:DNA polymerase-3 subunit delta'
MSVNINSPALAPVATLLGIKLEADALPHAVILEGGNAAQRKEAATALARVLLCVRSSNSEDSDSAMFGGASLFGQPTESPAEPVLPCEACTHCRKSAGGVHPDLQVLEGGSGARSFHIDAIRSLRQDAYVLPNEANLKVYVLHNAQTMSAEAQNALLKLLEEPPDYVCLIATVPQRRLLLQTVTSRAMAFSLGEAAEEALDPEREVQVQALAQRLAQTLAACKTPYALLEATAPLEGDKDLMREVLPATRRALHAMLLQNIATAPRLLPLMDGVRALESALERNANLNLLITQLAALGI